MRVRLFEVSVARRTRARRLLEHRLQEAFSGTDSQGKSVSFSGSQVVLSAK